MQINQCKKLLIPFLLFLILGYSAYLRLFHIREYMVFLGDQGRDLMAVREMLVNHKITFLGPTASVGGFFLGPIYFYMIAPFLWLSNYDPIGPSIMVALFGIATVLLAYKFCSDFIDKKLALIAALLTAISPLIIRYSRYSWNPNVVPFFALLIIYCLAKMSITNEKKWPFVIGLSLGILLQLHYLSLFLLPVVFIYLLIIKKLLTKNTLWILIGFLITISPFLSFELRHGFPNIQSIFNFIKTGKDTGATEILFWGHVNEIPQRLFTKILASKQPVFGNFLLWFSLLGTTLGILIKKYHKLTALLLIWFIFPLILYGLYKREIYDYYLGIIFIFPIIALVFSMNILLTIGKKLKFFLLFVFVSLLLFSIKSSYTDRPILDGQSLQVDTTERVVEEIIKHLNNKPFNFALITPANSDHAYRYFLEIKEHKSTIIETVEKDPERKTVTDQLIVLCEQSECSPLGHSLWEISGFGRAEIIEKFNAVIFSAYRLQHYLPKPSSEPHQ